MPRTRFQLFPPALQDAGPTRQFIWLMMLCVIGVSIASFLSVAIGSLVFGISLQELPSLASNPTKPNALAVLQISQLLSAMGIFLFPPLMLMRLRGLPVFQGLAMDRKPSMYLFLLSMLLMWMQLPLINQLASFNQQLVLPEALKSLSDWMRAQEDQATRLTELFLTMPSLGDFFLSLLIMAFIPALGEELLFRATLQPLISKWTGKPHLAIWVTAFVFSFIHFQFFGFLPRFLIGAFLGYLFYWSGSIWYSVAAHFANNGLAVLGYYLQQHQLSTVTTDDLGAGPNAALHIVLALLFLPSGIWLFRKALKSPLQS
jgi:membrane protease YdiL (CAAX protease family)